MFRRIDPELTARARELRNNPTETELAVWHLISRYRPSFTRQHIVAPFILDLACREAKLGIEFDGSQHLADAQKDERRSAYLRTKGWQIIRLWNSEVLSNPEGAVQYILERAAEGLNGVYPEPIASRERRERKPRWS
jgi:very-short-patch-repair endonuclease